MTKAVQEAVRDCGMNLNPSTEGPGQVNVPIPKPTKESREEVAKVAGKAAEKVHVFCSCFPPFRDAFSVLPRKRRKVVGLLWKDKTKCKVASIFLGIFT